MTSEMCRAKPPAPADPRSRRPRARCSTIRQAIVIGPTPPGTGVIAPATCAASAKATSPTSCDLAVCARHAVDADVDHGRARLDPVAAHHLGPADRREQQIGAAAHRRQIAGLANGRPSRWRSRRAAAAPAACRRCWSGRSPPLPGRRATRCTVLASMTQPSGVQGTSAGRPVASRPALTGWKPSTSLRGIDRVEHLLGVDLLRQRQLHQDAVHRRIGVELLAPAPAARPGSTLSGRRWSNERMPASTVALALLPT